MLMRNILFYLLVITVSCAFTAGLNVLHTRYILQIPLTAESFITPLIAGLIFGLMLAHIKLLSRRLSSMAYTDSLTGIYNRMHFNQFLATEIDKVKRYGGTFSIIFFDIDRFKYINDQYGHQTGDDVLRTISTIVRKANRSTDVFARYGGEEFILLAAQTDLQGAAQHAERLRMDIEQHTFASSVEVSCSFGVTQFDAANDTDTSLVNRADAAMYAAKHDGRNRVVAVSA
jgi:diguanylate cyclase (GGDEF)-like protein